MDRVDIITGTLGKALGGASGGYTSGRQEIIDMLRQRSRPYLFSNTVAPPIVGGVDQGARSAQRVDRTARPAGSQHAVLPRGDDRAGFQDHARASTRSCRSCSATRRWPTGMADAMLEKGVYVIGFSYPVVPQGKARIRAQVSAAHSEEDLQFAMEKFAEAKQELEI